MFDDDYEMSAANSIASCIIIAALIVIFLA